MKLWMKMLLASLLLALLSAQALADMPEIRGYDSSRQPKYMYVTFGEYFSDGYGTIEPVLWKVLGPGVPSAEDVSTEGTGENDNSKKRANEDVYTEENEDLYCLMTEYIIDFHLYNEVRDTREGTALEYKHSEMYRFLNDMSLALDEKGKPVGLPGWMFTENELAALEYMPDRGNVSLPSRKGELFRRDYGFINEDFREWLPRQATGTRYAFDQGLKYIVDQWSWYFTTDRRRVGFRWIVGDNGHTSVAGADREGGVRLVCYLHMDKMECLGGRGTKDDPYQLITRTDYRLRQRQSIISSFRETLSAQAQKNAFAVSRAQAEAKAREEEEIRLAAQARAEEQARREAMAASLDSGKTNAMRLTQRSRIYTDRTLQKTRDLIGTLSAFATDSESSSSGAGFEASPSGMTFYPAK